MCCCYQAEYLIDLDLHCNQSKAAIDLQLQLKPLEELIDLSRLQAIYLCRRHSYSSRPRPEKLESICMNMYAVTDV